MDRRNIIISIVVIVVIILLIVIGNRAPSSKNSGDLVIGAALSMTGPAAVWGENIKNGMELALDGKTGIKAIYSDTKGLPADGVAAFKFLQTQGVDVSLTSLSSVSMPVSKTALDMKVPLLVILSTADGIANDYTVRYYNNADIYAGPAFADPSSPVNTANKIAILYRNDDLGASVMKKFTKLAEQYNKQTVFSESFKPNETDYSTVLTKVKASGADVFIFVDANPLEAVGILKMAAQLKFNIPLVEASAVFADLNTRKQVAGIPFWSTAFDFTLPGKALEFKAKYLAKYGKEANFGAAFGYDAVNMIYGCKDQKAKILECLRSVKQITGVSGVANQVAPGDFVVTMHLEKVD